MDTLKILDELQEMIAAVPKNDNATDQIRYSFKIQRDKVKEELAKKRAERVGNKKPTGDSETANGRRDLKSQRPTTDDGGQTDKSQSKTNGE